MILSPFINGRLDVDLLSILSADDLSALIADTPHGRMCLQQIGHQCNCVVSRLYQALDAKDDDLGIDE